MLLSHLGDMLSFCCMYSYLLLHTSQEHEYLASTTFMDTGCWREIHQ